MSQQRLSSISVFFPAFNEEKNIQTQVDAALAFLPNIAKQFEIIVVDDGSTDNTGQIADRLAHQHDNVRVIHHPQNQGYGSALQSGYKAAKHDWTFFTDSDGQFSLQQLAEFVPHTVNHPAIIGYRTNRAEGSLRAFNAWLFKQYVNLLFRVGVKDIDCAFKLYDTQLIQNLPLKSKGAMISAEILYRLKKQGIHPYQIPVKHLPRLHGNPTGNNPRVVVRAGYEALRLYLEMKFG